MSIPIPSLQFSLVREDSSQPEPILEVNQPYERIIENQELMAHYALSRKWRNQFRGLRDECRGEASIFEEIIGW